MIIGSVAIAVIAIESVVFRFISHPKAKDKKEVHWDLKHPYANYLD